MLYFLCVFACADHTEEVVLVVLHYTEKNSVESLLCVENQLPEFHQNPTGKLMFPFSNTATLNNTF